MGILEKIDVICSACCATTAVRSFQKEYAPKCVVYVLTFKCETALLVACGLCIFKEIDVICSACLRHYYRAVLQACEWYAPKCVA